MFRSWPPSHESRHRRRHTLVTSRDHPSARNYPLRATQKRRSVQSPYTKELSVTSALVSAAQGMDTRKYRKHENIVLSTESPKEFVDLKSENGFSEPESYYTWHVSDANKHNVTLPFPRYAFYYLAITAVLIIIFLIFLYSFILYYIIMLAGMALRQINFKTPATATSFKWKKNTIHLKFSLYLI